MGAYIRLELHPYDHCSHCSRCWNLLYIYKEDLPWVWTGWGVSIISTNRDSYLKSKHNILRSLGAYINIRPELHSYDHRSHCSRCWNLLYIYKEDLLWVWSVGGVSDIRTNRDPPPIYQQHFRSQRANIRLELHPYDHRSHCSMCWNRLYIYKRRHAMSMNWTGSLNHKY